MVSNYIQELMSSSSSLTINVVSFESSNNIVVNPIPKAIDSCSFVGLANSISLPVQINVSKIALKLFSLIVVKLIKFFVLFFLVIVFNYDTNTTINLQLSK